jgi:hypothetical protein
VIGPKSWSHDIYEKGRLIGTLIAPEVFLGNQKRGAMVTPFFRRECWTSESGLKVLAKLAEMGRKQTWASIEFGASESEKPFVELLKRAGYRPTSQKIFLFRRDL